MRLRTIGLIVTLALDILTAPLAADAQAGKVYRIGYLSGTARQSVEHLVQEFERTLNRLGWVQSQNIVIEYRWAEGKYERALALADELVRLKVDMIVVPHQFMLKEIEVSARLMNIELQPLEARRPEEFDSAFAAMTRKHAGALLVLADAMFLIHRTRLAELAAKNRLPAMYGFREHVEAGGLMAYAATFADLVRRAAVFVDKILKGAKPADLPVEQPTRFELVINMKTAKALGLTIPQSVLIRADHVIQ